MPSVLSREAVEDPSLHDGVKLGEFTRRRLLDVCARKADLPLSERKVQCHSAARALLILEQVAEDLLASDKLDLLTESARAEVETNIQTLGRKWARAYSLLLPTFRHKRNAAKKEVWENTILKIVVPSGGVNYHKTMKSLRKENAELAAKAVYNEENLQALKTAAEKFIEAVDKMDCSCPAAHASGGTEPAAPIFEKMVCDCSPSSLVRLDDVVGEQVCTLQLSQVTGAYD